MIETLIWALDLVAVAYLCLWARRTDKAENEKKLLRQESHNA